MGRNSKVLIVIILIALLIFVLTKQDGSKLPLSKTISDFDTIYTGLVTYMSTKPPAQIVFVRDDFYSGKLQDYIAPDILPGSGKGDPWGREYIYTVFDSRGNTADKGDILMVWSRGGSGDESLPARVMLNNEEIEETATHPDEKLWAVFYISNNKKVIYERSNAFAKIRK